MEPVEALLSVLEVVAALSEELVFELLESLELLELLSA